MIKIRKLMAAALAAAILSASAVPAFAADTGVIYKKDLVFAPHSVSTDLNTDEYVYTDEFFSFPSAEVNSHLATASMAMCAAGIGSQNALNEDDPSKMPQNAEKFFKDLGFERFEANEDFRHYASPDADSLGVCGAVKTVTENGREYTLLAVVPRNANYGGEWAGNLIVGDGSYAPESLGFVYARERYIAFLTDYINDYFNENPSAPKDIKLWTAGYSRGAATVNISVAYLMDNKAAILPEGVSLDGDDVYCYTFGTPMGGWAGTDGENKDRLASYDYIHNYFSNYDATTLVAFPEFGFGRYGNDHRLNIGFNTETKRDDPENKAKMLSFLKPINSVLYERYVADLDTYDPDKIMIFRFKDDGSMSIEPDPENPAGLPADLESINRGRFSAIAALSGNDRAVYTEKYQPAMKTMAKYFKGDYSERPSKLVNNLMELETTPVLAASALAYYMAKTANETWENATDAQREHMNEQLAKLVVLLEQQLSALVDPENTEGSPFTPEYLEEKKRVVAEFAGKSFDVVLPALEAELREVAGDLMAYSIGKAAALSGYSEEEIAELTGESNSNGAPLIDVITALLFSGAGDSFEPVVIGENGDIALNWHCPQLCLLATLIGNASQFTMHTHANEIIKSWLMVSDSYYNDNTAYRTLSMTAPNGRTNVVIKGDGSETVLDITNGVIDRNDTSFDIYANIKDGSLFITLPITTDYTVSLLSANDQKIDSSVSEYTIDGAFVSKTIKGVSGKSFDNITLSKGSTLVYTAGAGAPGKAEYDVSISSPSGGVKSPSTGESTAAALMSAAALILAAASAIFARKAAHGYRR